jgi:hypothetical protein
MGCSHCAEDAHPGGAHMTQAVFSQALRFSRSVEPQPTPILLSGGEPTEHPEIISFLDEVAAAGCFLALVSNGLWLGDAALRDAILTPTRKIAVQVTYDPQFYPRAPPRVDDARIEYVFGSIGPLIPLGRARALKGTAFRSGAPSSFNLRSFTRAYQSFPEAVQLMRARALQGRQGYFCTPSILEDGSLVAGETRHCWRIGTVWSSTEEITRALLDMRSCNRCGLEDNLSPAHRVALGLEAKCNSSI